MNNFIKPEYDPDLDPVTFYNRYKEDHALSVFEQKTKVKKIKEYVYKSNNTLFNFKNGVLIADKNNTIGIEPGKGYNPFMLLVKYKFKLNYSAAIMFIEITFQNKQIPYIRVATDYFKKIEIIDRFGITRTELKRWNKQEIIQDYSKDLLNHISKFDNFIIEPNNKNYEPIINNSYNMYGKFSHIAKKGTWKWTKVLLEHVFGDQYALGVKYIQTLYLHPKKILPILVLASKTRSTGKSTFLDWMSILFGTNMAVITPMELANQFNSSYATSNIIGIEETITEKSSIIEKLKGLSTTKFLSLNQKFIDNNKIPFFGKFIITTNDETKFMKVDEEEIRFWIRKLTIPKFKNTTIDEDLVLEIPAFLHHLEELPELNFARSRMVFTPEEIKNDWLIDVKKQSYSGLRKELIELFKDFFLNNDVKEVYASASDIKEKWFLNDNRTSRHYISQVLKQEMSMKVELMIRYFPFNESISKKTGTPFCFKIENFVETVLQSNETEVSDTEPF